MKAFASLVVSMIVLGTVASAHGNNDHVRGVVAEISAASITVQVAGQPAKKLSLTSKTTYEKSGRPVQLADLKIGDRVVVDVPKGSSEALLIRFGAPAAKKGS